MVEAQRGHQVRAAMTDVTSGDLATRASKPAGQASHVAVAYLRAHLLMTESELADAKRDLADYAERTGYVLGTVYVESLHQVPSAFEALVTDLVNPISGRGASVVLVPGIHHLAGLGVPPDLLKTHLENASGARVLIARHAP